MNSRARRPLNHGLRAGAAVLLGALLAGPGSATPTVALFTDSQGPTASLTADTLDPPTALTALGGTSVILSWTPTVDPYAEGYGVYRATSSGGPYAEIGTATPIGATGYSDGPIADGTYWYVVRSFAANWLSAPAGPASAVIVSATTGFRDCSAQARDTGGDGNGYQGTPGNACRVDGLVATDTNSGSGTSTLCTSTAKDRHRFGAYNLGVPATATAVIGITVEVKVGIDRVSGTNRVCAELSWDGGSSWTSAQWFALTSTTLTSYALGGATSQWGRTWAPAELSDSNFWVRLTDVSSNNARDFRLDAVEVQVNYLP